MSNWFLYLHINKTNGKVYVGITTNIHERWKCNGRRYEGCSIFYNAIKKYGWDGFRHIVVRSNLTETEVKYLERRYIYLFRANNSKYGYNISNGGDGNDRGRDCYGEAGKQRERERRKQPHYREMERKRYHKHRDERLKTMKEYYQTHKEALKEYDKNKRDRTKKKEHDKRYYELHREERIKKMREYYQSHKEYFADYERKHRNNGKHNITRT